MFLIIIIIVIILHNRAGAADSRSAFTSLGLKLKSARKNSELIIFQFIYYRGIEDGIENTNRSCRIPI